MKHLIVILSILINGYTHVLADEVSFTASAPEVVVKGEQFSLSYTVDAKDVKEFQLASSIQEFDVLYGPARFERNSVQVINGKTTSSYSVTFTYTLMAKSEGEYTIPGATIIADGNKLISNSVKIKVLPPDQAESNSSSCLDNICFFFSNISFISLTYLLSSAFSLKNARILSSSAYVISGVIKDVAVSNLADKFSTSLNFLIPS